MSRDGLVTGELAPVLSSDLDGGNTSFEVISAREQAAVHEVLVVTLCEQALLAMTHSRWSQAEALAEEARTVFRRAGVQTSYAIPLVCAVQARAALHRGDIPAARQELIGAQRLRHLLTYAMPRIATQTRIELARVYLALGDFAGAETLIQEIDELLQRRPDLSSLADEARVLQARVLQARLPEERYPSASGESALTCAELRLLPMLATHLTFPQIAATMSLSPNTIKSQAYSLYRKLGVSSRAEAVARSRQRAGPEA
ncbi:MAG TPA: LuxR C-terminal-related transcriptional regulator [Streptosporangiaceae bacterium]|nr:LuxR C-terminal-related transcriptional regulator [Streptosporangiaceae bacterium]